MLRDDVVAAFLLEYEAGTQRLTTEKVSARPEREAELANLEHQLSRAKAAILKGVDATVFVDEMKIWTEHRKVLLAELELAEQETAETVSPEPELLTPDLGRVYRKKVEQLTAAFEDEALKAQAFEWLGAWGTKEARNDDSPGACATGLGVSSRMVAGTGFEPVTFRL